MNYLKKMFGYKIDTLSGMTENLITKFEEYQNLSKVDVDSILNAEQEIVNNKIRYALPFFIPLVILASVFVSSLIMYGNSKFSTFVFVNFVTYLSLVLFLIFSINYSALFKFEKILSKIRSNNKFITNPNKSGYIRGLTESNNIKEVKQERALPFDAHTIALCFYCFAQLNSSPRWNSENEPSQLDKAEFLHLLTGCTTEIKRLLEKPLDTNPNPQMNVYRLERIKEQFEKVKYDDGVDFVNKLIAEQKELAAQKLKNKQRFD